MSGVRSHDFVSLAILSMLLLLSHRHVNGLHCFACTSDDRKCPSQASVDARALEPVRCQSARCLSIVGLNDLAGVWRGCSEDSAIIGTSQKSGCYIQGRQLICVCVTDGCNGFPIGFVHVDDQTSQNLDYLRTQSAKKQRLALIKMAARITRDPWWRKAAPEPTSELPGTGFKMAELKSIQTDQEVGETVVKPHEPMGQPTGSPSNKAKAGAGAKRKLLDREVATVQTEDLLLESKIEPKELWISAGAMEETVYDEIEKSLVDQGVGAKSAKSHSEDDLVVDAKLQKYASDEEIAEIVPSPQGLPSRDEVAELLNVSQSNGNESIMEHRLNVKPTKQSDIDTHHRDAKAHKRLSGGRKADSPYLDQVNQFLEKLLTRHVHDESEIVGKERVDSSKPIRDGHILERSDMLPPITHGDSNSEVDYTKVGENRGLSLEEWNTHLDAARETEAKRQVGTGSHRQMGGVHGGSYKRPVVGQVHGSAQDDSHMSGMKREGEPSPNKVDKTTRLIDLLMQLLESTVSHRVDERHYDTRLIPADGRYSGTPDHTNSHHHLNSHHYPTNSNHQTNPHHPINTYNPTNPHVKPTPVTRGKLGMSGRTVGFDFRSLAPEDEYAESDIDKFVPNGVESREEADINNPSNVAPGLRDRQRHGRPHARMPRPPYNVNRKQNGNKNSIISPRSTQKETQQTTLKGNIFSKKDNIIISTALKKGDQKRDHAILVSGSGAQPPKPIRKAGSKSNASPKVLRPRKKLAMETYDPPWMHRSTYILDKGLAAWGSNRRRQSRRTSGADTTSRPCLYSLIIAASLFYMWVELL